MNRIASCVALVAAFFWIPAEALAQADGQRIIDAAVRDLDARCGSSLVVEVDWAGFAFRVPGLSETDVAGRINQSVLDMIESECVVSDTVPGRGETMARAVAASLSRIVVGPHSRAGMLGSLPTAEAERPELSFSAGRWSVGIAEETTRSASRYRDYLVFEAGIVVDGVPLSEAIEHGRATARLSEEVRAFHDACGTAAEVPFSFATWTGTAFNHRWVKAFESPVSQPWGPIQAADACGQALHALTGDCSSSYAVARDAARALAGSLTRFECLPDPNAAILNDPANGYDTSSTEALGLWERRPGGVFRTFLWSGSVNVGSEMNGIVRGREVPSRCERDPRALGCGASTGPRPRADGGEDLDGDVVTGVAAMPHAVGCSCDAPGTPRAAGAETTGLLALLCAFALFTRRFPKEVM